MASLKHAFPTDVAVVLRNADHKIRGLSGESSHVIYHFWRITMAKLVPVDSFYVGFYRPDDRVVFPYSYEGEEYDFPEEQEYGERGLSAWILRHKRPYLYQQDGGLLVHNGQNFGDLTRVSADAIAVPLFEPGSGARGKGKVVGLASVQSYQALSYGEEDARAFQWLADSVSTVLHRNREDARNRRELGVGDDLGATEDSVAGIVQAVNRQVGELRRQAIRIQQAFPAADAALLGDLGNLARRCEQLQTEVMEFLTEPAAYVSDLTAPLTPREKEVAALLAKDLTNEQIAEELGIARETVKTHVANVLTKFGVRQRAGVAVKMNRLSR